MLSNLFATSGFTCPQCRTFSRAVLNPLDNRGPEPGAFIMCAHCGCLGIITGAMQLRNATAMDLQAHSDEAVKKLYAIQLGVKRSIGLRAQARWN